MIQEPFRLFFPLGILLGWVGVGHWLAYSLGITSSYSCLFHGLVQTQVFVLAFALGFLMTALPRRTQSALPARGEILLAAVALGVMPIAAGLEHWMVAEASVLVAQGTLLRFALPRLRGIDAGRRPPPAFVLLPLGLLLGIAGSVTILAWAAGAVTPELLGLGRLLAEQGAPLCFVAGAGRLILPLVTGYDPPADFGATVGARTALATWTTAGVGIAATLGLEYAGWAIAGGLLRAAILVACMAHARRPPRKPGLHRWLVWVAVWMVPLGIAVAAVLPAYRIPALHIVFIGGFGTLVFGVATHVALGHLGLVALQEGRPPFVVFLAVCFALALVARLAADASHTYFIHLGSAAGVWLAGASVWLGVLGWRLVRGLDPGRRG